MQALNLKAKLINTVTILAGRKRWKKKCDGQKKKKICVKKNYNFTNQTRQHFYFLVKILLTMGVELRPSFSWKITICRNNV